MLIKPENYFQIYEAVDRIKEVPEITNPKDKLRQWLYNNLPSYILWQDGVLYKIIKTAWGSDVGTIALQTGTLPVFRSQNGITVFTRAENDFFNERSLGVAQANVFILKDDVENKIKKFNIKSQVVFQSELVLPTNYPPKMVIQHQIWHDLRKEGLCSMEVLEADLRFKIDETIKNHPDFNESLFTKRDKDAIYSCLRQLHKHSSSNSQNISKVNHKNV